MVREDLINSAVSFLQDPSVASAPVEQRTAFLRSKNLTKEEIDLSLQRAGSEPVTPTQPPQNYYQPSQPYPYQNAPTNPPPQSYWQHPPQAPPELPRRDWRDWFIMATVLGGVSYGVYTVAKRYVVPLIQPPTAPQLEQDKAAIDSQFDKAFALLDQLATDTDALKKSEQDRTERLDVALAEVEAVIGQMKESSKRRDDEGRRITDEVRNLKDMVPKALDAHKDAQDQRLKDLAAEMKSLKTLISNRMAAPAPAPALAPTSAAAAAAAAPSAPGSAFRGPSSAIPSTWTPPAGGAAQPTTNFTPSTATSAVPDPAPQQSEDAKPTPSALPDRSAASSPYGRLQNGRAAIPAWQMAAAKKNQEAKENSGTVESSPDVTVDGAAPAS